jgi:hypothetical protein
MHRHAASLKIGRWIRKDEVVHHEDGDKANNEIHNLSVMTSSEHTFLHYIQGGGSLPEEKTCKTCGKHFTSRRETHNFCSLKCSGQSRRRVEHPSLEGLKADMESMSWLAMGRKYGVSDNAVRKWARKYGLLEPQKHKGA